MSEEDVHRNLVQERLAIGRSWKKALMPSVRRQMAVDAVNKHDVSIQLACEVFQISQTCYRYSKKRSAELGLIADWLIRLTIAQRNWSFGLCFLYLRNVKGFVCSHKRCTAFIVSWN